MLMVQSKPQAAVKSSKVKPPPPVPPRPNQNVVAEALAKTRKAVAESKLTKPRPANKDEQKAKTLERTNVAGTSPLNTSPKLNGLARVKSFIRDVISDRSSSEDRKSHGNSRRSSVDTTPSPLAIKNPVEQKTAAKTIKSCRQALVRSLSTSTKSEQESKGRVLKSSSSFADKALPLRKAPPPPLSPKPKLREIKPVSLPNRNSMEIKQKPKISPPPLEKPPLSPQKTVPVSLPETSSVSHPKTPPVPHSITPPLSPPKTPSVSPPQSPPVSLPKSPPAEDPKHATIQTTEAPYATVDEVADFDNRLSSSSECERLPTENDTPVKESENTRNSCNPPPQYINSLERKTSRVTERLISEIIASKNKPKDTNNVIDKGKETDDCLVFNGSAEHAEGVSSLKDMNNHEMLIYELQTMRSQTQIPKPEGEDVVENLNGLEDNDKCSSGRSSPCPSIDLSELSDHSAATEPNTFDVDDPLKSRLRKQFRSISSMSLQGLPPLPKSLSGFAEGPLGREEDSDSPSSPEEMPKPGDMEAQLAYLKREMASLRRLDLSLLSELWSLNESMASWRQQLERAPPRLRPAPPPPPPPPHYLRT